MRIWVLMLGLFISACTWVIATGIKALNELDNERHYALMAKLDELENILSKYKG